jgi:hypothetical protein
MGQVHVSEMQPASVVVHHQCGLALRRGRETQGQAQLVRALFRGHADPAHPRSCLHGFQGVRQRGGDRLRHGHDLDDRLHFRRRLHHLRRSRPELRGGTRQRAGDQPVSDACGQHQQAQGTPVQPRTCTGGGRYTVHTGQHFPFAGGAAAFQVTQHVVDQAHGSRLPMAISAPAPRPSVPTAPYAHGEIHGGTRAPSVSRVARRTWPDVTRAAPSP